MGSRLLVLAWLPFLCMGCQLVDPSSGLTGGGSTDATTASDAGADADLCEGATFCDTFDRDTPIPSGDAVWKSEQCAGGGMLSVNDSLDVTFPNTGGAYANCVLASFPTQSPIKSFTLAFDLSYTLMGGTSGSSGNESSVVIAAQVVVALQSANSMGIENMNYELLLDGEGQGQLVAVPYYPGASNPYPTAYHLADLYLQQGQWLPSGTTCHIAIAVDAAAPSGTASATCPGKSPVSMIAVDSGPPPGFPGTATLSLGYVHPDDGDPYPQWNLTYGNMVFRTSD